MNKKDCQIVVVEDNEINARLLGYQLAHLGFERVQFFGEATSALEWLRQNTCTMVLTDCQMRPMNGFELTRALREHELQSKPEDRTIVIAVTAGAMPQDLQRCLDCGMDDYLVKPVQIDALGKMIDKWLSPQDSR